MKRRQRRLRLRTIDKNFNNSEMVAKKHEIIQSGEYEKIKENLECTHETIHVWLRRIIHGNHWRNDEIDAAQF